MADHQRLTGEMQKAWLDPIQVQWNKRALSDLERADWRCQTYVKLAKRHTHSMAGTLDGESPCRVLRGPWDPGSELEKAITQQ